MADALEPKSTNREPVDCVAATVFARVDEFELVLVRTAQGFQCALTPETPGVDLRELYVGQHIECVVTRRLPRVLHAKSLD